MTDWTVAPVASFPLCDFCCTEWAAYDAAMRDNGPWGYMCEACFPVHSDGTLGLGRGQRLVLAMGERVTE